MAAGRGHGSNRCLFLDWPLLLDLPQPDLEHVYGTLQVTEMRSILPKCRAAYKVPQLVHAMYLSFSFDAGMAVPELRLQPGVAATLATPPAVSRPGKLTPAAEARLLLAFGLQDTLTREEALILAEQASSSSTCNCVTASNSPFDTQCKPVISPKAQQLHGLCLVVSHSYAAGLRLCSGSLL